MKNIRSLTGDLKEISVPEILRTLYLERMTGMLALRQLAVKKFFFFQDGKVIYAISSTPEEQLGRILVEGHRISEDEYQKLHSYVRSKGWAGEDLYRTGIIGREDLEWWTKVMIRDLTLSVFRWTEGYWRFFPDRTPGEKVFTVPIDTMKLIMGTVRRLEDLTLLRSWIGSFDESPRIRRQMLEGTTLQELNLTSHEGFVLSRIDGRLSLRQIVSISGPNKMDTVKFLFGALLSGVIEIERPGQAPSSQRMFESSMKDGTFEDPLDLTWEDLSNIELSKEEMEELDIAPDDFFQKQALKQGELTETDAVGEVEIIGDDGMVIDRFAMDDLLDFGSLKARNIPIEPPEDEEADEARIVYIIAGQEVDAEEGLDGPRRERKKKVRFSGRKALEAKTLEDVWEDWIEEDIAGSSVADQDKERELADIESRWTEWTGMEEAEEEEDLQQTDPVIVLKEDGSLLDDDEELTPEERRQAREEELADRTELKKREILYIHQRMQNRNHYAALGLREDADEEQLREAFFRWSSAFNPDRTLEPELEAIRRTLEELYSRIREAYQVLADPDARFAYDAELRTIRDREKRQEGRKKEIATRNYLDSLKILEKGDSRRAMDFLRAAISLDPYRADFFDQMADILSADPRWRWEALRYRNRAIQLEPRNATHYVRVGQLFEQLLRPRLARKAYKMALRFDSSHGEATSGLQALPE